VNRLTYALKQTERCRDSAAWTDSG